MKITVFILAWLCLHFNLQAQTDTSYRGKMDYLLQPLKPGKGINWRIQG